MKKCISVFMTAVLILISPFASASQSHRQHPEWHVKHNMILVGETEIFASHIVYKVPHNFQVILKIKFDPATLATYRTARAEHPGDTPNGRPTPYPRVGLVGSMSSIESNGSRDGT